MKHTNWKRRAAGVVLAAVAAAGLAVASTAPASAVNGVRHVSAQTNFRG